MRPFFASFCCMSSLAMAQDPHADHPMPAAEHDHSQMEKADEKDESDLRDPHAYSNGYTSHSGPYHLPDMTGHVHGGGDTFSAVLVDRLELAAAKDEKPLGQWEIDSWVGSSFDKLWLKTEGEIEEGKVSESENEMVWAHAISPYWDSTLGVRYDAGGFAGRAYAALGIRGLAPYWFESSASLYIGDRGRLAIKAELEYDLLFSQKLILSPRLELDLNDLGQGEGEEGGHRNQANLGLRLRYEIYRRLAPYIGLEKRKSLVGLKFWF